MNRLEGSNLEFLLCCIILGDYLAFYHILEYRKAVFVSDIIHSKQDYIRLFKKK